MDHMRYKPAQAPDHSHTWLECLATAENLVTKSKELQAT